MSPHRHVMITCVAVGCGRMNLASPILSPQPIHYAVMQGPAPMIKHADNANTVNLSASFASETWVQGFVRILATLNCKLDFREFPFDTQVRPQA
jgi:hypothetical protein